MLQESKFRTHFDMIADRCSASNFEQLNLDNRSIQCRCWSGKNKFYSLASSRSSSSADRSDTNSLKMNHLDQLNDQSDGQSNGQSNRSSRINQTDSTDRLTQLAQSSPDDRQMNHLNHFSHLSHSIGRPLSELDLQFDDCEQFFVPIESYEVLDKRTKFTVYKLKVECLKTSLNWCVYRRFTDFQRLNAKLTSKYANLDLSLPGKSLFDNVFSPSFIEKRQLGLQLYLNRLMSSRELLKDLTVRRFLCIDEPPIASLANDTYPSSVYSDSSADQPFACSNCYTLEKKLDQMQIALNERDAKIRSLERALESTRSDATS